jgi:hypothetical protein
MLRLYMKDLRGFKGRRSATGLGLVAALLIAGSASANWQGTVNSDWANINNWGFQIPTAGMDAYILFSSNDPEVSSGTAAQCSRLFLPAYWVGAGTVSMTVSGGTLDVGADLVLGSEPVHNSTLLLSGGEVTCNKIYFGDNSVLDIAGGQLTISDLSARMQVRLLIDQGKIVGYGGTGRIKFDSVGTDLVLTAELTDDLAQSPSPVDLATQVASGTSTQLTWTAGTGALSHDLYFSTNATEIINSNTAFIANQTETTFSTPVLSANTVYYWRVDEVAGSITNRGDVWSFRTDNPGINRPTIGVIRWDMYSGMGATQAQELGYLSGGSGFLAPTQWNWRAPFFCRYTNDVTWVDHVANGAVGPLWFNSEQEFSLTQEAMEQEIAFAGTADAGLDYWIFGTLPASAGANGWGVYWNLDAFLESERRLEINYALMYRLDSVGGWAQFDLAVEELVWHAKQPNYQTVLDGRPLIYFIDYKIMSVHLGDPADGSTVVNLAAAVQLIRDAFVADGLPEPYLVASAVPAHAQTESNWINGAGFDAGSDYWGGYGGSNPPPADDPAYASWIPRPFSEMGAMQEPRWNLSKSVLGEFIPNAPCGVDARPRYEGGFGGAGGYGYPEPGDLTALVNRVFDWVDANQVEANTCVMYSWNEHSEGGALNPLIGESPDYIPDTSLLDEVSAAINAYGQPVVVPPLVLRLSSNSSTLDFEWNSRSERVYDLEAVEALTNAIWSPYNDGAAVYTNIPASPTGTNILTGVLINGPENFFRVAEKVLFVPYLSVADGSFENPPGDGQWRPCHVSWNDIGGEIYELLQDTGHMTVSADGSWCGLMSNMGMIYQDLGGVNAGDILTVTFSGGRSLDTENTAGGGVFNCILKVGSSSNTVQADTTLLSEDTWQTYTNTWVATETGTLRLEFSNVSGKPWIDNVSDVKVTQ